MMPVRFTWTNDEELFLLHARAKLRTRFDEEIVKSLVWGAMSQMFSEQGYNRNGKQLEDKWNKMKSTFSKEFVRQRAVGREDYPSPRFRHYEAMRKLIRHTRSPSPTRTVLPVEMADTMEENLEENTPAAQGSSHSSGDDTANSMDDQQTQLRPRKRPNESVPHRAATPVPDKRCIWTVEEERLLVASRSALKERFEHEAKKSAIWQDVSQVFAENGFSRSGKQLEDKWYKLTRSYNGELAQRNGNHASASSVSARCRVFEEMHRLSTGATGGSEINGSLNYTVNGNGLARTRSGYAEPAGLPRFLVRGNDDESDSQETPIVHEPAPKRRVGCPPADTQRELMDFLRSQAEKQDAALERAHGLMEKMLDLKRQQLEIFKSLVDMGK